MRSRDWGVVLEGSVQYGGPYLLRKRRSNRNSDRKNEGHDGKSNSDENSGQQNGSQARNQNQNGKEKLIMFRKSRFKISDHRMEIEKYR